MVKKIELTQGKCAIVDDEDFELVNRFKWYASKNGRNWYALRKDGPRGKQKTISLHRFLMGNPSGSVDHVNRDGLDCRRQNMRVCLNTQNSKNTRTPTNNKSGYRGVSWSKKDRRWRAQIAHNGKVKYLGNFQDPVSAAIAYDKAAKKYHGEFASLNFD